MESVLSADDIYTGKFKAGMHWGPWLIVKADRTAFSSNPVWSYNRSIVR